MESAIPAMGLGREAPVADFLKLMELGWIRGNTRNSKSGEFRVWKALDAANPPFASNEESVRTQLPEIVDRFRGNYPDALYKQVRREFMWLDKVISDSVTMSYLESSTDERMA